MYMLRRKEGDQQKLIRRILRFILKQGNYFLYSILILIKHTFCRKEKDINIDENNNYLECNNFSDHFKTG